MALVELAKNLELVEVAYDGPKASLTFFDEENGIIRTVNFNKQAYNSTSKKFEDNAEKAERVEGWCKELFNETFDTLTNAVGTRKDVYVYEGFNSLFEVKQTEKFPKEMVGDIFTTTIDKIEDDGMKIAIEYQYDDKVYMTKFQYAKWIESLKRFVTDPSDKKKAYQKFENKLKVPFEEKESLIGTDIMVEVKLAGGKYTYGEIKERKVKK